MHSSTEVDCRICRKVRRVFHGLCDGCGHPVANIEAKPRKPAFRIPVCPVCHCTNRQELEPGRFCCVKCLAVFEPVEQFYVDDRPLQNAMKQEATNGRRANGRHR